MNAAERYRNIADQIELAMIALTQTTPSAPVSAHRVRDARRNLRQAQRLIEDGLSGPRVARTRRIAAEVAMTGMEQEIF